MQNQTECGTFVIVFLDYDLILTIFWPIKTLSTRLKVSAMEDNLKKKSFVFIILGRIC